MPFGLQLVGMDIAVPVLNFLGLLSGIYVFVGNHNKVDWKVLRNVVAVMGICVVLGIFVKKALSGSPKLLYIILGVIVVTIAVHGLIKLTLQHSHSLSHAASLSFDAASTAHITNPNLSKKTELPFSSSDMGIGSLRHDCDKLILPSLLVAAGIVHGMFVCGGPLLISYMTKKLPEKAAFRATISTVWIFLNGIIFVSHIITGAWTPAVIKSGLISVPFLFAGMFIGGLLYKKMSQRFFILLTYVLLLISGASLFLK